MKRLRKAMLLPVKKFAYRRNLLELYYWADQSLFDLRNVHVMPMIYYRLLFRLAMRNARVDRFRRLADKVIHTIPYHVRFNVA